ncbi:hypothetical protein BJX65DRAFT_282570 [Aspergillus insuetus]
MVGHLNLQPMLPLREAIDHDDNWTGLIDARERRKRQNRLNQRAHRRRKEQAQALCRTTQPRQDRPAGIQLYFPLSVDHLLTLVQFNTYRGLLTNAKILSLPTIYSCGDPTSPVATSCASQFEPAIPLISTHAIPGQTLPPQLLPTTLQQSTLHEPWIDIFPLPTLRDNLLRLRGAFDSCELCDDILGALFNEQDLDTVTKYKDRNGLIIWGEPWDVGSWELMEGFVDKWGFLLEGCEVLIEGTNRWRAVRGEGALISSVPV